MSEDCHDSNLAEHPFLKCMICQGPIGIGEPVSMGLSGTQTFIAHRFVSDCEWHKDPANLTKQDSAWLKELGVSEGETYVIESA